MRQIHTETHRKKNSYARYITTIWYMEATVSGWRGSAYWRIDWAPYQIRKFMSTENKLRDVVTLLKGGVM